MRNILITNDDGIESDGIIRLARAAVKYGKVYVVAPDSQRSAMSHCITLRESMLAWKVDFPVEGVEAYASTATPADCVRFGKLNIVKDKNCAVLSGINYGYNSGNDIQYSATVGAAMEAATSYSHAIAFSEGMCDCHEVTDQYLDQMLSEYLDKPLEFDEVWNINFPQCKLSEFKGILTERTVAHTGFYDDAYAEEKLPDGKIRYTVSGVYKEDALEGTDVRALIDNYISVGKIHNIQ